MLLFSDCSGPTGVALVGTGRSSPSRIKVALSADLPSTHSVRCSCLLRSSIPIVCGTAVARLARDLCAAARLAAVGLLAKRVPAESDEAFSDPARRRRRDSSYRPHSPG